MLRYAIILNHNDPVGFAEGNLASISLCKTNKQTKSALHFPVNIAQDSARSELSSTFKSAAAVLAASQIKKP